MKKILRLFPYIYFSAIAFILIIKNLLHPAIDFGWWFVALVFILFIFLVQARFRTKVGDILLATFAVLYALYMLLAAYSDFIKLPQFNLSDNSVIIAYVLLNFFAAFVMIFNTSKQFK